MPLSFSLKMFGWTQNRSRSVDFASWGNIDTAWVIQKYRHRFLAMKNIGIGPKDLSVELIQCFETTYDFLLNFFDFMSDLNEMI